MKVKSFQKTRMAVLTLSTNLFPVTFFYLSPIISMQGSTVGIITGSIVVFLLQFLSSLFLGRTSAPISGFSPFMEIGGGIGYHVVVGDAETSISLGSLSAVSFSAQVSAGG